MLCYPDTKRASLCDAGASSTSEGAASDNQCEQCCNSLIKGMCAIRVPLLVKTGGAMTTFEHGPHGESGNCLLGLKAMLCRRRVHSYITVAYTRVHIAYRV
jgi:hypothetical protein